MGNVTFVEGQGGLGRSLPGQDYISGMVFYTASLPSGFTTSTRTQQIFSIIQAQNLGITNNYSDETRSTATYLVTNAGAAGDTISFSVVEPKGAVLLGSYTRTSAATTVALVAVDIAAAINSLTLAHGYTATVATATITITARKGLGVFLNSGTPYSTVIVGTIAGTLTQNVVPGVASLLAIYWYHISEYFRIQPQGNLYVGFYAIPSSYIFAEVTTMQNFSGGIIRQFAVYINGSAYSSTYITNANAVAETLRNNHMPCDILIGGDISAVSDLSTLTDLSGLNSRKESLIIAQDGYNYGFALWKAYGKSITALGAALGTVALAKVSESIAWKGKFNLSAGPGLENDVAAFANGQNYSDVFNATPNLITQLQNYRYIYFVKNVGSNGTFFNDSHTCTLQSSDYAFIENNRTIDKAERNLYAFYLPKVSGPLTLNADGTLTDVTVYDFQGVGETALDQMVSDGELSGRKVTVNPAQNVQSTNTIVIAVQLLGVGVARNITVNIGFVLSIN